MHRAMHNLRSALDDLADPLQIGSRAGGDAADPARGGGMDQHVNDDGEGGRR